jgi:hypothetical protein
MVIIEGDRHLQRRLNNGERFFTMLLQERATPMGIAINEFACGGNCTYWYSCLMSTNTIHSECHASLEITL